MQVSNIHMAYGDDSVFQVLVGYNKPVGDGTQDSNWTDCGYVKIRAVKDSNGLYLTVIRASNGLCLFEGKAVYEKPESAVEFGIEVYKVKFMV